MIKLENLCFEYPNKLALDNISFYLEKGSITALVGPNGAGKTTLMNCIAALEEPISGSVTIDGIVTTKDPRQVHKKIGYLADFFGIYKYLTVRQSLEFFARIHQINLKFQASETQNKSAFKNKIEEIAHSLNLSQYLDFEAGSLSRGFRQVLGIAQALIHDPEILILDEPTSGLDPEARENLANLFHQLSKRNMTILVSSHIISELEDYCQDMILIRDGKLIEHCKKNSNQTKSKINKVKISLFDDPKKYLDQILTFDKIVSAEIIDGQIECEFNGEEKDLNFLLKNFVDKAIPIAGFSSIESSLKDIYFKHSKKI
ncbi:MAG: ABC transporter ATP-binding protein [Rickettsiales bacterium]|nr:ABC transporter ATP-binding protein [Rickettsiales bacterium]